MSRKQLAWRIAALPFILLIAPVVIPIMGFVWLVQEMTEAWLTRPENYF